MRFFHAVVLFAAFAANTVFAADKIVWPTESTAFVKGESFEAFIQPTFGHEPKSGLFGDVRNNGYRFHEGIDIKPVRRSKRGEPLDSVYAAMRGIVALVNDSPGASSYGRYVVIEHDALDVPVYTLYAHLRSIDESIKKGVRVESGCRLGQMGRSADYAIAREAAHLHFEVGLRYGEHFQKWYDLQKFGSKNKFGVFNGMNLQGMDPLAFMNAAREGKLSNGRVADYISSLPTAFIVRYYTAKIPDFALRYPKLADLNGSQRGWDIHFTWYGLPKKIERIKNPSQYTEHDGIEIIYANPFEINRKCRVFVKIKQNGKFQYTELLKDTLKKMFM